jgi:hypothetical protein
MSLAMVFGLVTAAVLLGLWMLTETTDPARPGFWHTLKYGRETPPPKSRRQELLEARARIRRQMQILETPIGRNIQDAPPPREEAMGELQRVLDGIEEELRADGWRKG